jgi:hypothetical protein
MGRSTGHIALHATLSSRDVDCCLIPETKFYLEGRGDLVWISWEATEREWAYWCQDFSTNFITVGLAYEQTRIFHLCSLEKRTWSAEMIIDIPPLQYLALSWDGWRSSSFPFCLFGHGHSVESVETLLTKLR